MWTYWKSGSSSKQEPLTLRIKEMDHECASAPFVGDDGVDSGHVEANASRFASSWWTASRRLLTSYSAESGKTLATSEKSVPTAKPVC